MTHQENVRRGDLGASERSKTHCPQGHPYDEANTYRHNGHRSCRTCHRGRERRRGQSMPQGYAWGQGEEGW